MPAHPPAHGLVTFLPSRDFDTSLSAELGALSGFLIGRCAEDQVVTVQ